MRAKRLEKEREELEREYGATVQAHISAQMRSLPEKPYLDRMEVQSRRLQEIAVELPEAQADAAADVNVFENIRGMMQELSAVAEGWDVATNEQKRYIFGQWIDELAVDVESDDNNRSVRQQAVLTLQVAPDKLLIDLGLTDFSPKETSPCRTRS
jgi:hypothetical protein